jgi:hypothetical protein
MSKDSQHIGATEKKKAGISESARYTGANTHRLKVSCGCLGLQGTLMIPCKVS